MKNLKAILIPLLIGVTIFSVVNFFFTQKEKNDLVRVLSDIKAQVGALENEKQVLLANIEKNKAIQNALSEENVDLKSALNVTQGQLTELDIKFQEAQKKLEQLVSLQAENEVLRAQKDNLSLQVAQIVQEKDALQEKFNSLSELKKAIVELKKKMRLARKSSRKIEVQLKKKETTRVFGNRGFLVKDGKSTFSPKINIEVVPIP